MAPGTRKVVAIVIDGLPAATFEAAASGTETPTLRALAEAGSYRRAVSAFPSLTPVCLSTIATGGFGDVHGIPHLVWYHRGERRVVEYGSSFGALRAAGLGRSLRDTIVDMNARHLRAEATTIFEAADDAGLTSAAVNFTAYRGRTTHRALLPGVPPVRGPRRFFFYNLFESDRTGAPLSVRKRAAGTIDDYAAAVGRWLVTRDGFDVLVYYLSDYDFASHALGPDATRDALARSDAAVRSLVDAAGGLDEFLERYAVILLSDHGQTAVREVARLEEAYAGMTGVLVTASNRAGMVYRLDDSAPAPRALAERLDPVESAEIVVFGEDGAAVARRAGGEVRFEPDGDRSFRVSGDAAVLADMPLGLERAWSALANPNSGEVLVSAAPGYEFADLGGRHHRGGGSHGSLTARDSEVPVVTIGLEGRVETIADVAPLVLCGLGLEPPRYAASLRRAA
jgi:Type I phosphodiesterase / nucleotide pyrophosphatase